MPAIGTLVIVTALTAAPVPAQAQQTFWTGAASNDWFNSTNWSNGVPGGGDSPTIDTITPNSPVVGSPGATARFLDVGAVGIGQLTIQGGGTVRDVVFGTIGVGVNSFGTVTVTGVGSQLEIEGGTNVGSSGTGTLTIANGGTVSSGFSDIGAFAGSTGTVTVTGAGSQWIVGTFDLPLEVGTAGTGTLNITNGGSVSSLVGTTIGHFENSLGTVTVTGAGSQLTGTGIFGLIVGREGTGQLTIADGGTVSGNLSTIGNDTTGTGTALVTGAGSQWNISGTLGLGGLVVGLRGAGTLTIADGGTVSSDFGRLGAEVGSIGRATVTGAGSQWTMDNDLAVGREGRGTLNISNGGRVSSTSGTIGEQASGIGTVSMTGIGSQWTNSGNLAVGSAGDGALFVINGGTVSDTDGTIGAAGTGTVAVTGAGSQWINSGELLVGDTGTGTLTIANGGTVSTSFGTQVALQAGSTGTVNIGAAAGQAPVAPGALSSSFVLFGAGSGTLNFNHTATDYVFAPQLAGNGAVNVLAGTTILTANSISYTGPTTVNGGTLIVNGVVDASPVTVNAAGIIGGVGTLGATTINGGTLSPGRVNAIGTVAIQGNLAFSTAATYLVQITPSTADRTNVTGTATLDGTVRVVAGPGSYTSGTTYTIVNAGTVNGIFDGVTTNSIFLNPTLSYDANNAFLTLALNFVSVVRAPNQIAIAGGVQSLGGGNAIFDAIFSIGSAGDARAAFDLLSGEVHASAAGVMLDESRYLRDTVLGRARQPYGIVPAVVAALGPAAPAMAYAPEAQAATAAANPRPVYKAAPAANDRVYAAWAQVIGAWGRTDSDGNAASLDRNAAGFISGVDATFADRWRLGMAGGYTRTSLAVDARASSADIDSTHVAVYGGGQLGGGLGVWGLRGGGAFTRHEITTNRSIVFPGFADHTKADYDAHSAQVFGEIGYGVVAGRTAFEPFAAVAYVNLDSGGFNETGGQAALTAGEQSLDTTFTTLGLRAATVVGLGNGMTMTARGTLGWRHAFGDVTPALMLGFVSGGVPFTVAGVPIAQDSALVEAGLDLDITANAKLGIAYSAQLAGDAQDHTLKGNFIWRF